ncbi:cupin domain-containing protein [Mesorhizobium sp. SP-1A]|uniref:cupin domain-containing protein n=1 Tax=Mesorhizobium sp. SP-1A TaxID=3077840 RepID=UPI0028F717CD|nr:cupin domain-containing protein [Mesorhizobium sp. SP-1A]
MNSETSQSDTQSATLLANTVVAIGSKIRDLRQTRNMKLQELADATGLSSSMLSLLERGKASPSIGSLIGIAHALSVTMSDLIPLEPPEEEKVILRSSDIVAVETGQHVLRRILKEDRARGVSVAINEYRPNTGSGVHPHLHRGFEYGYVLVGELTVELEGASYKLEQGDFISFESRKLHRFWNYGKKTTRTIWFNTSLD